MVNKKEIKDIIEAATISLMNYSASNNYEKYKEQLENYANEIDALYNEKGAENGR